MSRFFGAGLPASGDRGMTKSLIGKGFTTASRRGRAAVARNLEVGVRSPENRDQTSHCELRPPMKTFLRRFLLAISGLLSGFDRVFILATCRAPLFVQRNVLLRLGHSRPLQDLQDP